MLEVNLFQVIFCQYLYLLLDFAINVLARILYHFVGRLNKILDIILLLIVAGVYIPLQVPHQLFLLDIRLPVCGLRAHATLRGRDRVLGEVSLLDEQIVNFVIQFRHLFPRIVVFQCAGTIMLVNVLSQVVIIFIWIVFLFDKLEHAILLV